MRVGDDGDFGRDPLAQPHRVPAIPNADEHGSAANSGLDPDPYSWPQAQTFHFAQSGWISIRNATDDCVHAASPLGQQHLLPQRKGTVPFRDEMAMRVCLRIAQFRRDTLLQTLGYEMLQPFRLVVDLIPGIIQKVMQETLQQTVVAQNFQGAHLSSGRQTHAVMLFILHMGRLLKRQLLEHSSNRSGTDAKTLGERVAGHARLLGAAQLQDRFQVIVDRLGAVGAMASRRH